MTITQRQNPAPALRVKQEPGHPRDSRAAARRVRQRTAVRRSLRGAIGLLVVVAVWQLVSVLGLVHPSQLPSATAAFGELSQQVTDLEFWRNVGRTMSTWAVGLAIASVAGIVLVTVIGLVPFLRRATHTVIEFLRPIPSVALIPIAVLTYGIQPQAALVVVIYASLWQVLVQVLYGVADIDAVGRDTARSFRLPLRTRLGRVILPTAMPYLVTGLRLAAAVALILAITAEMTIGNPGLGRQLTMAAGVGDQPLVYAIVIVTGILGLIINLVFRAIEKRALHWHQSIRGEEVL